MYATLGTTGVREQGKVAHCPDFPGDRRRATDEVTKKLEVVGGAPGHEGRAIDATR